MKPRIKKFRGDWYCYTSSSRGKGDTPDKAYQNFKNNPSYLFHLHQVTIAPWMSLKDIQKINYYRSWDHMPNWERVA